MGKALSQKDEALRELAKAARWVDRSAFGKEEGFGQAHQALLKHWIKLQRLFNRSASGDAGDSPRRP